MDTTKTESNCKQINKTELSNVNSASILNDTSPVPNVNKSNVKVKAQNKVQKPKANPKSKPQNAKVNELPPNSPAKIKARELNRPAPPPPLASIPAQTRFDAGNPTDASDVTWPPRRELPELPVGEITQDVGIAYCKKLSQFIPKFSIMVKGVSEGLLLPWY